MMFKRLTTDDTRAVFALENECFSQPWSEDVLCSELSREGALSVGVFRDNELVGYSINLVVLDELQILKIAVKHSERGKGIASKLMRFIFEEAWILGVRVAYLEVRISNIAAQALYRALGFRFAGERKGYYEDNGEDAILMRLELVN